MFSLTQISFNYLYKGRARGSPKTLFFIKCRMISKITAWSGLLGVAKDTLRGHSNTYNY